ncbi:ABC transporter permease [Lachnospiraceae bacterium Oil+RF-744-WCA-WT-13]|jgi:putative ABC transport system permease protein|uniref:ABC transporter permease n=2 Tax=Bilifractor porci TaxID=2606636 RepID=A0A7X2TN21_9FIRM|nr:ABC transporter permease [Bilifractor porci]MST81834.1 ABC transporter permease [Bilifractor porci]
MNFLTPQIVQTALEVGLIYGLVALSLFISFSILDICDLSTDGCYTLGCAVGAVVTIAGHPVLALFASVAAGICSGYITALLQTKFGVQSILAGIIVNTGLYTINLAVMGFSSNLPIFGTDTVFTLVKGISGAAWWQEWSSLIFLALILALVVLFIKWFLGTRLGLSIRATGDSPAMVRASSINPQFTVTVGLCFANAMTGLAGSLIGQYNKTSDINLGTGMVTIALASLIIGETISRKSGNMLWRISCVVLGSCLYRFIISIALRLKVPTEAFKLVSAIIVAIACAAPAAKDQIALQRKKAAAMREHRKMAEEEAK